MKKLLLQSALLAAGFLLLAGCTNVATFDYSAAAEPMVSFAGPPEAKSIAVLPFLDQRSRKSLQQLAPAADSGSFYLGLLPLMPYGYVKKPFPERSDDFVSLGRFHFNPSLDLAEASVLSLKASRLFGRVELADSAGRTDAEYLWRGSVNNTFYSGAMLTYCISYFLSPALWAVGAPEGVSRNALGVSFELVERATRQNRLALRLRRRGLHRPLDLCADRQRRQPLRGPHAAGAESRAERPRAQAAGTSTLPLNCSPGNRR